MIRFLLWLGLAASLPLLAALTGPATAAVSLPAGGVTVDFATVPSGADFASVSVAGGGGDLTNLGTAANQMDNATTGISASLAWPATATNWAAAGNSIATEPAASTLVAPIRHVVAPGSMLTGPTGVRYHALIGRFQNNTGSAISSLDLAWTLGSPVDSGPGTGAVGTDPLAGIHVYFSKTGLAGSWTRLNGPFGAPDGPVATATIALTGVVANGADLYIAWVDDNSPGSGTPNFEGNYTIDDIIVSNVVFLAGPDIAVAQSSPLTDEVSSVAFGTVPVSSSSAPLTFTITNPGGADLTSLMVIKDGPDNADFTVSALSATSIPVGAATATFTVAFTPGSTGVRTAAIHIASNVSGSMNPFDITLTGSGIISMPMINNHPAPLNVTQGQQAMFEVTANGWNLSYQWKKGSVPINGATAATYTIPATLPTDAGSYAVVVSNEGGSVTSDPAVLTVYVSPGFTQEPANATVAQRQSVTLMPSAEGSGTLTWQWRKDGLTIPGATSSSYAIPNAQPWHSGNYSAVITNGIDSATSLDAAVRVSPFPFNVWQGLAAYYPLNVPQPGQDFGIIVLNAANQGASAGSDSWGRSDGARRFVASESDGMATASGAFFHSQPNFTWTALVKTSGTYGSASTRIISTEGPDGSGQAGFGLYANSNGRFGAGLNWGGGGQGYESAAVYAANVWRHLAVTYDGSRLRLYVDGAQAGSRLYTGITLTSDLPLCFGKYRTNADGSTGGYFDGWLDDVRFYNRVLTAADLLQLRASDDGMDLDNDGLGDAWEARYGFSAAANEGSGDADGDGMTNRDEYLAGSSPVSAVSNFHAPQLTEVPGLNVLNLTWHGSPTRNYAVQVSPDLTTWATIATLPGMTGPTSLVVEAPLRPVRHYYKVVVVP